MFDDGNHNEGASGDGIYRCILNNSSNVIIEGSLLFQNDKFKLEELGFEVFERDQGTGYHIPEGILLTYGEKSKDLLYRFNTIDTKKIAPLILRFFNLEKEKYMEKV